MRITILGLPGSGKSTLAKKISEKLHIPHIHLDHFWLEAGGGHNSRSTPDPERAHANVRSKALEAIQQDSWVSDGVFRLVQPEIAKRADVVILLDIPLWRRLLNHAARTFRREASHDGMTFWKNIEFFPELIQREFTKKPKIKELLEAHQAKLVTLHSRREVAEYLQNLR